MFMDTTTNTCSLAHAGFALPNAIFANCDIFLNLVIENKNWRKKMATTKNDLKSPSPA